MTTKRTPRKLDDVPAAKDPNEIKIDLSGAVDKDELQIDDDPKGSDKADPAPSPTPAPSPAPADKEDPVVADLKKQLQESNEKNTALEAARKKTLDERNAEKIGRVTSEGERVETEINATTAELERLEKEAVEAFDAGENSKGVKLNRQIAAAEYKLNGLNYTKSKIDEIKEKISKPSDAQEDDDSYTPAARSWIDRNPKFNTDRKFHDIAMAAHYGALADGVVADSAEYFRRLDESVARIDGRKKDADITIEDPKKDKDPDADPTSFDGAPPSRSTGGSEGGPKSGRWLDANTYRPSADEIEAAEICGYMTKEGKPDVAAYIRAKHPEKFKQTA